MTQTVQDFILGHIISCEFTNDFIDSKPNFEKHGRSRLFITCKPTRQENPKDRANGDIFKISNYLWLVILFFNIFVYI